MSKSITFLEKQFHGLEVQEFPAPSGLQVNAQGLSTKQFQTLDEYFPDPKDTQNLAHSDPGLLYAAWALAIGHHTRIQDVIFGTVPRDSLSPLQRPLARLVKPTRVSWTPDTPVSSFLHSVQAQIEAINQYSDIDLDEISELSSDAEDACKFRTVVRIRDGGGEVPQSDTQNHNDGLLEPLAIILECKIENGCTILAKYDESLIDKQYMSNLFAQFIHVYHQLRHAIAETAVCNIDPFCPQDLTQVQKWNKDQPPEIHQVVCGAFDEQYFLHPNALAVCSWDGELTYRQLHDLSSSLAGYLVKIGVRLGTIVPLCFDKSIWAIVSMVAVMRAGGCCVNLSPYHSKDRLQRIITACDSTHDVTSICRIGNHASYTRRHAEVVLEINLKVIDIPSTALILASRKHCVLDLSRSCG